MSRNGSGTYSRVTGTPYVYNTTIDQVVVNAEMDDIATALTNSLAKDGQTAPTANLPMGGYKLTGLAAGSGNGESVRYEQVGTLALAQGAAALAGSATQVFSVEAATAEDHAVSRVFGDARYAELSGATFTGPVLFDTVADIASAATIDLTGLGSGFIAKVTGTTPISALTMSDGQFGTLVAEGVLPFVNTATTCEVLGGDFTAVADDQFTVTCDAAGVVRVFPHSLASRAQADATQAIADAGTAQAAADLRAEIEIIEFTRNLAAADGSVNYPVPSGRTPKRIEVKTKGPAGSGASSSEGVSNGTVRFTTNLTTTPNSQTSNVYIAKIFEATADGADFVTAVETISAGNVALAWTDSGTAIGTGTGAIICYF